MGCAVFGVPVWIGILALSTGARMIGGALIVLGTPVTIWILVYAKPMTLVVTERYLEFRTFGRRLVVPYERLNHVWLTHTDRSLLDFFRVGLRGAGTPFSSLRAWYLFTVLVPTVSFFATIGAVNGWNDMVDTLVHSWLFWGLWWLVWALIFVGVRVLVVPAMKKTRVKDATLMFDVDPQLLDRQPFSHYRLEPICLSFTAMSGRDRERIAFALESNCERLPENSVKTAVLRELKGLSHPFESANPRS